MFLYKHSVDNTWNWRVQKRRGWHFTLALWRIICGYPFLRNVGRLPLPCCIPEGVWKANNPSLLIVLAFLNKDLFYFGLVTADPAPCPDPWTRSWPDLFSLLWIPVGFLQPRDFCPVQIPAAQGRLLKIPKDGEFTTSVTLFDHLNSEKDKIFSHA